MSLKLADKISVKSRVPADRRALIKSLLGSTDRVGSSTSVGTFRATCSFEECSDGELLALADLGVRAQDAGFTRGALSTALERGSHAEFALFKMGMLELRQGHHLAAARWFSDGVAANPSFGHNLVGLARTYKLLGRIEEARAAAAKWMALGVSPLRSDDALLMNQLVSSAEMVDAAPSSELGPAADIPPPLGQTARQTFDTAERQYDAGDVLSAANTLASFLQARAARKSRTAFSDAQQSALVRVAHGCFEVDRSAAYTLYECIEQAGIDDYLTELRLVEAEIHRKLIVSAAERMDALSARHQLDAWGMFAKAQIQHARGETDSAIETVLAAAKASGTNNYCKIVAGYRLLDFRALDHAHVFYDRELAPLLGKQAAWDAEIRGLKFRESVLSGDHQTILKFCRTDGFLATNPMWMTVEALFTFALPGEQIKPVDIEIATILADFIEGTEPFTLGGVLSLYQFYSRRRMWDRIAQLETRVQGTPLNDHQEIRLRRFETLCAMSRMQDAKDFYKAHYTGTELGQWEACVVLRFLAEAQMWEETGELFEFFVRKGYYFPGGEYFLLKICRRAKLHRRVIDLIDTTELREPPAQFPVLRQLLLDDLVLRGETSLFPPTAGPAMMSDANRALFKAAEPPSGAGSTVAYLCADKAYFLSVLTFLASVAAAGPMHTIGQWYIFLAADVPKGWHTILRQVGTRLGLSLVLVPEAEFVAGDAIHVEAYGIFTGGNTLSRAAFLRIYAAKHLLTCVGGFERALYIDSDIICTKDLASFSALEFGDALLMARAEEPSPEVQSVVERHGLAPDGYFNSGVLALNFKGKKIGTFLDEAIRLAEHESARLVFHDQCALNLAFAGRVKYLEPTFNFFLRPHRPDNGDLSTATLLHFLDKPKPWDLAYRREYRTFWVQNALTIRSVLSAAMYNTLVAEANK